MDIWYVLAWIVIPTLTVIMGVHLVLNLRKRPLQGALLLNIGISEFILLFALVALFLTIPGIVKFPRVLTLMEVAFFAALLPLEWATFATKRSRQRWLLTLWVIFMVCYFLFALVLVVFNIK